MRFIGFGVLSLTCCTSDIFQLFTTAGVHLCINHTIPHQLSVLLHCIDWWSLPVVALTHTDWHWSHFTLSTQWLITFW